MDVLKTYEGKCFLGRTLEIEYGNLRVAVTLDVGPRIILFRRIDGENIMFNDTGDQVSKDVSAVFGKGEKWHLYGGHRIWASPEDESTYVPDNTPVSYTISGNSIEFIGREWEKVCLKTSLKITVLSKDSIMVGMKITNTGADKRMALWALTVFKPGGLMEASLPSRDTGYLPNRNLVMWPYSSITDSRFSLTDDMLKVRSSDKIKNPFKVGFYSDSGKIRYTLGENIFTKTFIVQKGYYPDMNCNVETYASDLIHEVETLSPLATLKKGQEIEHDETWTLIKSK